MLARFCLRSARSFSHEAHATTGGFHFNSTHGLHVDSHNVEAFVRRVTKCVRERLLAFDPQRWQGVEISYNSNWLRSNGQVDIATCIQVHEALEKEFKFEIMDQRMLVTDMRTACSIVADSHDAI